MEVVYFLVCCFLLQPFVSGDISKSPEPPTHVTVKFLNQFDPLLAKVTWIASPGAVDFYRITIQKKGTDFQQVRNTRRGSELFTFLERGEKYVISVASNTGGRFSANATLTVETPILFDPYTAKVKNLTVTSITSHSVQVSWEPPRGMVEYYTLEYSEMGPETERLGAAGQSFPPDTPTGTRVTVTLNYLKPATNYSLTVRPDFVEGRGLKSETSFRTAELISVLPDPPTNITVKFLNQFDPLLAKVTWNASPGEDQFYQITIRKKAESDWLQVTKTRRGSELFTFLGLGETYEIRVAANTGGKFSANATLTVETPTLFDPSTAKVKNFTITSITPHSVQVSWEPPRGKAEYYILGYSEVGENFRERIFVQSPDSGVKITLDNLKPATSYSATVRPYFVKDRGMKSEISFRTTTLDTERIHDPVKDCLSTENCWVEYNFTAPSTWNDCAGGAKYVKKNHYSTGKFLGVELCTATKYKLFLSDNFTSEYKHIADGSGHGTDHCEMMAARGVLSRYDDKLWASGEGTFSSPSTRGFYRSNWGDTPVYGNIGAKPSWTGNYYPKSYKCGIAVPGSVRVVKYGGSPDSGLMTTQPTTAGGSTCRQQKVVFGMTLKNISPYHRKSAVKTKAECVASCEADGVRCSAATFRWRDKECLLYRFYNDNYEYQLQPFNGKVSTWVKERGLCHPTREDNPH